MVVKASVVGVRWEESRITKTGKNKVLAKERRKGKSFHGAHGTGGSDVFIYGTRNGKWQKFTKVCESFGARFRLRSLWRMQNSVALRLSHTAVFYNFDMINPIRTITMFSLSHCWIQLLIYLWPFSCTAAAALSTDTKCETLRLPPHFFATDFHFTFSCY